VFLEHEFSAENINFYTSCLQFKEKFSDLTQSQKISMASTVFQQYLQNGATDSVNVDFQVCLFFVLMRFDLRLEFFYLNLFN